MPLLRLFFAARIKSLRDLLRSVSAMVSEVSLSKPARHCRSCFIWQFFGLAGGGIKNSARSDLFIRFSPGFVSGPARLRFFFSSKRVVRFLPCRQFYLAAQ